MIIIKHISLLNKFIAQFKQQYSSIGFVPTMGALHAGHISLIQQSNQENPVTIASIFVNPTQFNNPNDFKNYPDTLEKDIDELEKNGLDILYLPQSEEIYPEDDIPLSYELGYLETILEGKYRPGHFQGVCQVVDKLLSIVKPTTLYLGSKDYQQCMVIQTMVKEKKHQVNLAFCPTVREPDGLAMSSRNLRLNENSRKRAGSIFKVLMNIKSSILQGNPQEFINKATEYLQQNGFETDYVSIADAHTLMPVEYWDGKQKIIGLVAASIQGIRLIDNLPLN